MSDKVFIPFEETRFGFIFGNATVERMCHHDSGAVTIGLRTDRIPEFMQIYVTRTGKVRIWTDKGEWKPEKRHD